MFRKNQKLEYTQEWCLLTVNYDVIKFSNLPLITAWAAGLVVCLAALDGRSLHYVNVEHQMSVAPRIPGPYSTFSIFSQINTSDSHDLQLSVQICAPLSFYHSLSSFLSFPLFSLVFLLSWFQFLSTHRSYFALSLSGEALIIFLHSLHSSSVALCLSVEIFWSTSHALWMPVIDFSIGENASIRRWESQTQMSQQD